MEIELVSLDKVHVHEEIIPKPLSELLHNIKSSQIFRDPVIVDSRTLVVLDGMHRVAALRDMGCRYVVACLVDYLDPKIVVGCWNRVIRGEDVESKLMGVFKLLGLKVHYSTLDEATLALAERKATAAFLTSNGCQLLKAPNTDIRESYDWIRRIEGAIKGEAFSMEYSLESESIERIKSGEAQAALLLPQVHKDEVLEASLSGNIFIHKTTRHILPARPMNVGVPLEWLMGDRPLDEVNRLLAEKLSERKLERLPYGSVYEGRKYDEELLVFR
ncbi:MAG: ABC transporter ATP-binding protein [Methanobacteriota archaeon]